MYRVLNYCPLHNLELFIYSFGKKKLYREGHIIQHLTEALNEAGLRSISIAKLT